MSKPVNKIIESMEKLTDKINSENKKGDLKDLKKIIEWKNQIDTIKTNVRLISKKEKEIEEIEDSADVDVNISKIKDYEKEISILSVEDPSFFFEDSDDREVREITEKRIQQLSEALSKALRIHELKHSIGGLKKQIISIISNIDMDSGKRKSKRLKKKSKRRSKKQNRKKKSKRTRV
jgi:hypothetical protein